MLYSYNPTYKLSTTCLDTMDIKKIVICSILVFALVVTLAEARIIGKRSPEEGEESGGPPDWCASAFLNHFSFATWCEDGTVGAKPPAVEE